MRFNAESRIPVSVKPFEENNLCLCGDILRGSKTPDDCPLFRNICDPVNPVGACMVSPEGTCNAWYKYRDAR